MTTPEAATLPGLLRARVSAAPDELAYADAERRVSYAELDASARRIAAGLQARGLGPGDHVALVLEAGVGFAEAFWAVQHLGAVPCALNPAAPAEMLARRAQRVRAALVVDEGLAAELRRSDGVADEGSPRPDQPAFLQTTSGTSGEPRTAVVTHANVFAYHDATAKAQPIGEGDVLVTWVPHWHDLGLVNFVVRPVRHGVPCHIVRPAIATIPLWMETIGAVRGTVGGTPDFALRLAARLVDPARADLSSLRAITNGGEPVRATTVEAFERHFGISDVVYPGYGLAEATLGVTATPWGSPPLRVDERGNVACGPALGAVELRAGTSPEALGEILVRGPTVFAGYLDEPEATAEVLRDGWLHTGDLGYVDAEGLLYILGRERAIIKRGGAMFAPREFEEAAIGVPGVRLAVAVGVPARGFGSEEVVVAVEVKERSPGEVEAEVSAAVRRSLGFAPERVLVVPPRTIPSTLNGKVRHARMRELLLAGELG